MQITPSAATSGPSAPLGDDQRVVRVLVEGSPTTPASGIRAVMYTGHGAGRGHGRPGQDVLVRDEYAIAAFLQDQGYLDASVEPLRVIRSDDGLYFDVHVRVHEGTLYRIGSLTFVERDVAGTKRPPVGGTPLLERLSLRPGQPALRGKLVAELQDVRTQYADAGYGNVDFDVATSPDRARATMGFAITLDRGELVQIARVSVVGNERVPAADILRAAELRPGEQYGESKLEAAKRKLVATGLFQRIDVSIDKTPSSTRWTVTLEVTEQ